MKIDLKILGERIKEQRTSLKITQKELSESINVTPSTVTQYEKGLITPTAETLVSLSKALGVSTDYLLGAKKEKDIFLDNKVANVFHEFKHLNKGDREQIMAHIKFLRQQKEHK